MADVFTREKRSAVMAAITGKNTKPERVVRSMLHQLGFRFRLHDRSLPGSPDIILPRHRKIVFTHGCFWHAHKNCPKSTMPKTNAAFWEAKIFGNRDRDERNRRALRRQGWKVLVVWECELKNMERLQRKLLKFMEEDCDENRKH